LHESQQKARWSASIQPHLSSLLSVCQAEIVFATRFSTFFLDMLNESELFPHALAVSEHHIVIDGRERIRVFQIHQMNYFDDDVCL